jgi:hypothetical protein
MKSRLVGISSGFGPTGRRPLGLAFTPEGSKRSKLQGLGTRHTAAPGPENDIDGAVGHHETVVGSAFIGGSEGTVDRLARRLRLSVRR